MSALRSRAQALLEDDPYVQSQGIELIYIDEMSSVLEMTITADQRSFLRAAHGGCLFFSSRYCFRFNFELQRDSVRRDRYSHGIHSRLSGGRSHSRRGARKFLDRGEPQYIAWISSEMGM